MARSSGVEHYESQNREHRFSNRICSHLYSLLLYGCIFHSPNRSSGNGATISKDLAVCTEICISVASIHMILSPAEIPALQTMHEIHYSIQFCRVSIVHDCFPKNQDKRKQSPMIPCIAELTNLPEKRSIHQNARPNAMIMPYSAGEKKRTSKA